MTELQKKRGRPKGASNKNKNKYKVEVYDILTDEWRDGGSYASYYEIGERFNFTYDIVRDIKNGRNNRLNEFIRIKIN